MKRYLPFVIVGLVALLAIGSGALLYRSKRAATATPNISKNKTEPGGQVVHTLGPDNAAVTLEEFGDYQCPPCGHLAEPINKLQKQYNLRVIFRNFPLPGHKWAKDAACAAEAAGRQGKFWPMHDLLFHEQTVWSQSTDARALFQAYAGMLQLDLSKFREEMDNPEVQRQIEMDQHRGAVIGVVTTPTIFLNNQAVPSPELVPDEFPKAVEAAVKDAKPPS
jgi:protein-disulfide isomerase